MYKMTSLFIYSSVLVYAIFTIEKTYVVIFKSILDYNVIMGIIIEYKIKKCREHILKNEVRM